jgi:hypothetical protein
MPIDVWLWVADTEYGNDVPLAKGFSNFDELFLP